MQRARMDSDRMKVAKFNKERLREAVEALDDVVTELKDALLFKDSDETLNAIADLSKHAKALSKVGASKGGKARAKALSPERRRIIAKHAAMCRWAKKSEDVLPRVEREAVERGIEDAEAGRISRIELENL